MAVLRPRLLSMLRRRFDPATVLVVAGPGFGKTTLVQQSIDDNKHAPLGVDRFVALDSSHNDASRLLWAMSDALSLGPDLGVDALQTSLRAVPLGTALVIDDAHELEDGSPGAQLLAALLDGWPHHLGLAVASRRPLAVTARATRPLVLIGEQDLRFDHSEIGELLGSGADEQALSLGRPSEYRPRPEAPSANVVQHLADVTAGWPALVALRRHSRSTRPPEDRYLWEEVLESLDDRTLTAMAVTSAVGQTDREILQACAEALGREVGDTGGDLFSAVAALPLVATVDSGAHEVEPDELRQQEGRRTTLRAHSLWETPLAHVLTRDEQRRVLRAAGAVQLSRDRLDDAYRLTARADDAEGCAAVIRRSCEVGYERTHGYAMQHWLVIAPPDLSGSAEHLFLRGVTGRMRDTFDPRTTEDFADAAKLWRSRSNLTGEAAALSELVFALYHQDRLAEALPVMGRLFELQAGGSGPAQVPVHLGRALLAQMNDDDATMLRELSAVDDSLLPPTWRAPIAYLRAAALLWSGQREAALAEAERSLAREPGISGALVVSWLARWVLSPSAALLDTAFTIRRVPKPTRVDLVGVSAVSAVILAGAGRLPDARREFDAARAASSGSESRVDFSGFLHFAEAAIAVAEGHDHRGEVVLRRFLALHDPSSPRTRRVLRVWPSLATVLVPELREHVVPDEWTALLLALRNDMTGGQLPSGHPLAEMPLVWTVELQCRLHAAGRTQDAATMAARLMETFGDAADAQLRVVAQRVRPVTGEDPVADAAATLLRLHGGQTRNAGSRRTIEIRLLGPLEILCDGVPLTGSELRRGRVRQLIALIALHSSDGRGISRAQAARTLWPSMTMDAAAHNLRVNLAHLERATGLDLRDTELLRLPPTAKVDTAVLAEEVTAATAMEADPDAALARLEAVLSLVRGTPLVELQYEDWASTWVLRARQHICTGALLAAEQCFAVGVLARAIHHASMALEHDPWLEPAHRLIASAWLALGDRVSAGTALTTCRAALAELGVEPDEQTLMVERRLKGADTPLAVGLS